MIDAAAKLALLRAVLCRKELCLGGLGSVAASRARSARGSSPVTVSATVGVRARAAAPCGARAAGAQRYALLLDGYAAMRAGADAKALRACRGSE